MACYEPTVISTAGIWQGTSPLQYSSILFVVQVTLIVVITRSLVFLLKPLRQPRIVFEILGGVLLGPSMLGRIEWFNNKFFPPRGLSVLETMSNVGLIYSVFIIGVELDLTVIKRTGKKAVTISLLGMLLPFVIASFFAIVLQEKFFKGATIQGRAASIIIVGVCLSVTAFPVLARILAEFKLLSTELGRIAMSSAIFNDLFAWALIVVAIGLAQNRSKVDIGDEPIHMDHKVPFFIVLAMIVFLLLSIYGIRPAVSWIIRRTPEGSNFNEFYISLILTGVMVCGFITDGLGAHSLVGAFIFGLVIPNGPLGAALVEKLEDFVSGLLLPIFFVVTGQRTNLWLIGHKRWSYVPIIFVLAGIGKLLINNLLRKYGEQVVTDGTYAIMVLVIFLMTTSITPIVTAIYKPTRRFSSYKRRTIQGTSKRDSELRVLACVHTPKNVPTIINLLEASHPTKKFPIFVYTLHLVELTGRASAMLIVHSNRQSGRPALNRTQAQSDHIISAFENYEQHAAGISVQPFTAVSPYATMHEDICNIAEDKRVAFIILPFHKQQTVDGGMEVTNPAIRNVNQNVFVNAPCSVGVLIDRGLGGSARVATNQISHHIAVLFFGGPDDREALSYAWRMAEHPGISVTVLRFVAGEGAMEATFDPTNESGILSAITEMEKERKLDDDFINNFRLKNISNDSIIYIEKVVGNGEETVAAIRGMDNSHDLYIVGRGQGMISPLTVALSEWSECPELGVIGDLLASSDFAATVSVLVVQQFVGMGRYQGDGMTSTPDSPGSQNDQHMNNMNRRPTMGVDEIQAMNVPQRGTNNGELNILMILGNIAPMSQFQPLLVMPYRFLVIDSLFPSPHGWIKLNCNGATLPDERAAGAGIVSQDHLRQKIAPFSFLWAASIAETSAAKVVCRW
ncbi:hypothetical protein HHK36_001583 [Tetracentron sinense]|uniref:Cation/H+ exchanger domain-containing protein n=1 Tax=Tetracentron sinense TaxID=13715 RepID=A0A834ZUA6_TETSI|nr:hypothetical protein HHK36_001583 [Tetracentron sinense]